MEARAAAEWLAQRLQHQLPWEAPDAPDGYGGLSSRDQDLIQDDGSYLEKYNGYDQPHDRKEAFLLENAELALQGLELSNKSGEVTEELFRRDVLPFRHFDEPVDSWRSRFIDVLRPIVKAAKATDLKDIADIIVPQIFSGAFGKTIEFKGNSTPAVMAPLDTLENGFASCTGISIFMADALRAVGVPARVVGTPEWNIATGGNHNWVEVYWHGGWHFLDGAPTSSPEWDRTWFLDNAQQAVPGSKNGIYTPVVDADEADAKYLITWREPAFYMPAKDRTLFYKHINPNPKVDANGSENKEWNRYRQASEGVR